MVIFEDFEGRFRRHLPKSDDLTLIVLKGHLLIEEMINRFITSLLANPDALAAGRLTFHQRVRLLQALLPRSSAVDKTFHAVEKLNTLRNRFAHDLEPAQVECQIEAFVRQILSFRPPLDDPEIPDTEYQREPVASRLKHAISYLGGRLHGLHCVYVEAHPARKGNDLSPPGLLKRR